MQKEPVVLEYIKSEEPTECQEGARDVNTTINKINGPIAHALSHNLEVEGSNSGRRLTEFEDRLKLSAYYILTHTWLKATLSILKKSTLMFNNMVIKFFNA